MDRYTKTETYSATYAGKGEFYSGIETGARVTVREETTVYTFEGQRKAHVSVSVSVGGAWLAINDMSVLTDATAL